MNSRFRLLGMVLTILSLAAFPWFASAQFLYEEDFTSTEAPGWLFFQGSTSPGPRLTAESNALSVDPEATGLPLDTDGQGWLRLATTTGNQANAVTLDTRIPSAANNILIDFDVTMWDSSSGTGADGITFFAYDASVPSFDPGGFGGSLGYAQRTGIDGLDGAYFGVGLDPFGNFSNPTESRVGGPGSRPGEVVVRGPGSGLSGYPYLAGTDGTNTTQPGNPSIPSIPATFSGQELAFPSLNERPDQDAGDYRRVQLELTETDELIVRMQFGFTGSLVDLFTVDISAYTRPDELRIGFTGGTGGVNQVYEVRNLTVETSGSLNTAYWAEAAGGSWDTGANWATGNVPTSGSVVVFNDQATTLTGPVTVTVNGANKTVDSLFFGGAESYTLTPAASQTITLDAATGDSYISLLNSPNGNASHTLATDLVMANDLRVNQLLQGETLTISGALNNGGNDLFLNSYGDTVLSGVVSGSGDLIKQGSGNATLSAANTYSGTTTVEEGLLEVRNNAGLGATSSGTTVQSGGTLGLGGGITVGAESLTITGSGADGLGALRNLDGSNSYAGNVTLGGSAAIGTDAGSQLTTSGTMALGSAGQTITFQVENGATHTHTGNITTGSFGGDRVIKTGEGTLVITSSLSHQGANVIEEGVMEIRNAGGLGSAGSVGTTVEAGGTLALANNISLGFHELRLNGEGATGKAALWNESGNNSVANNVTLQSDSSIGANTGTTLTLNQGITSGGGFDLVIEGDGTVALGSSGTGVQSVGLLDIQSGTFQTGGNSQIGTNATTGAAVRVASGADLNLGALSGTEFLASLSGGGDVQLSGATFTTVTMGGDNSSTTYSGVISGNSAVVKTGTGTMTFSGANTFSNRLEVTGGGGVALGADNVFANSMELRLNNGTLVTNGNSDNLGTLNRAGTGTLDFSGISGSTLNFAATTGSGNLTIDNWTGSLNGGGNSQFDVSSVAAPTNLSNINFTGWGTGAALVGSAGAWEIVPTLTGFSRWDGDTTIFGVALWTTSSNWTNNTVPTRTGTRAYFGDEAANSTQTPYILEPITVGNMILAGTGNRNYNFRASAFFGDQTITFNQTGSNDAFLIVTGTQSHVIGSTSTAGTLVNVALSDDLQLQNNSTATTGLTFGTAGGSHTFALGSNTLTVSGSSETIIHNLISGSGDLVKDGAGILELTDANTYSGGTTLNEGTLQIGNNAALGTGDLTINGGTLEAAGAARNAANDYAINDSFTITGANTLTLSGDGTVAAGSQTLTVDSGSTGVLSGDLTGTGGLIKSGDGSLELTGGTKTFSGGLTIDQGDVTATRSGAITLGTADSTNNIAGSGEITVNAGGTFNLTQTSANNIFLLGEPLTNNGGNITITSSGSGNRDLIIGTSAGTPGELIHNAGTTSVTVTDDIQLSPNSRLEVNGGSVDLQLGDDFVTGGTPGNSVSISVTGDGALSIDNTGGSTSGNQISINADDTLRIDGASATATFTGESGSAINLNGRTELYNGGTLTVTQGTTNLAAGSVVDGGTGTSGTLVVQDDLTVSSTATITNAANLTFDVATSSTINAGTANTSTAGWGNVTKTGAGTTTIGSNINNIDANRVTVEEGTLLLSASNQIANTTDMTFSGGTFATGGNSEIVDTLTLTSDSTIDLGNGASILRFSDSSGVAWTGGEILTVTNWSGNVDGGGTDQLYIGTTNGGVTSGQLSQIRFVDPFGSGSGTFAARILSTGEIVPVPEPATILAGVLLLGWAGWRRSRCRGEVTSSE